MPNPKSADVKKSYEELAHELDSVIANLQRDELDVDEALKNYQRGLELTKILENYLNKAESQIKKIKAQT